MMVLEDNVRSLTKEFNSKFQTEINKYLNRIKNKKGTVYTNAERGIGQAKGSRTIKPIQFTTTTEFQNLRAFETGANILGKGLIVLDAGIRAGKVHTDYLSGKDWQKRAAVETAGFGTSTFFGIAAGQATIAGASNLGIALLATPAGWIIIMGAAITIGMIAAKSGDIAGKIAANQAYDLGTWLNSL